MEIVIGPHLRRGLVNHPPIAYTQDGLWVRCSGQEPKQLYLALRGYNCPPAWSPDGEWVYYANGNEILALRHREEGKVRIWSGSDVINWLLKSCSQTGRLLFKAGSRLVLCEPEGIERTLFRGDFFTLDATLAASKAIFWKEDELFLHDWTEGRTTPLISDSPTDFSISLDGQKIALADDCLWLHHDDQFTLLSSAIEAASPSFSPDSQRVAFLNGDYELWGVNLDGSELARIAWVNEPIVTVRERRCSYAFNPAWSSDGRFLVAQLTYATAAPDREGAKIEHASVIVDFQEASAEIWPGYHSHAIFRPTSGSSNFRWTSSC